MGTRSATIIKDRDNKKIVTIYRQYDGYPSGHGKQLLSFIKGGEVVNSFSMGAKAGEQFNGVEDFAAQFVEHIKDGQIGNVYLYAPLDADEPRDYWDAWGVEYLYVVNSKLEVKCFDCYENKEINLPLEIKKEAQS